MLSNILPAVLLAGRQLHKTVNSNTDDPKRSRREPKPWWKPASREQALAWGMTVVAACAAVAVPVYFTYPISTPSGIVGLQIMPLDTFTSNLAGKLGSGDYAFVQLGGGGAAGRRRLAAASSSGVFRVSSSQSLSSLSSAAAALTLTHSNGTAVQIDGHPYKIERRGNLLLLSARSIDVTSSGVTSSGEQASGRHSAR